MWTVSHVPHPSNPSKAIYLHKYTYNQIHVHVIDSIEKLPSFEGRVLGLGVGIHIFLKLKKKIPKKGSNIFINDW